MPVKAVELWGDHGVSVLVAHGISSPLCGRNSPLILVICRKVSKRADLREAHPVARLMAGKGMEGVPETSRTRAVERY